MPHKAPHHPLCDEGEDSGLFVIIVALSDEVYALNRQLGALRKNALSYKRDIIYYDDTETIIYKVQSSNTLKYIHAHTAHKFILSI